MAEASDYFKSLVVGDTVERMVGVNRHFMFMRIMAVTENVVICAALDKFNEPIYFGTVDSWKFSRKTGLEEDLELGWGDAFRRSGTYLKNKG